MRILAALAAIAAVVFLGRELGGLVMQFASWVESLGWWGPVAFIAGYVLATVAMAPGSVLTLAGGAIFGLVQGTIYVVIGSWTGASLAFLVSRYAARAAVERRLENRPRFARIDRAVGREGFKIVTLLRLSPIFPFNLLNYALGLTRVRFSEYLAACVGMIPGTFLYVYYGKALGSLAAIASGQAPEARTGEWILLGVGLIATIAVTTVVTRIARRELSAEIADDAA